MIMPTVEQIIAALAQPGAAMWCPDYDTGRDAFPRIVWLPDLKCEVEEDGIEIRHIVPHGVAGTSSMIHTVKPRLIDRWRLRRAIRNAAL